MYGYDPARVEGVFASGGAEANHTALSVALIRASDRSSSLGAAIL